MSNQERSNSSRSYKRRTEDIKPPPSTLTVGQISRMCGVAPRTVVGWCSDKGLKCYHIAGSRERRIEIPWIVEFLSRYANPIPPCLISQFSLSCGCLAEDLKGINTLQCPNMCEFGARLEHGLWASVILGDVLGTDNLFTMIEYARTRLFKCAHIIAVVDPSKNPDEIKQCLRDPQKRYGVDCLVDRVICRPTNITNLAPYTPTLNGASHDTGSS